MEKHTIQNTVAVNLSTFAINFSEEHLQDQEKRLATQLCLPFVSTAETGCFTFILILTPHGLHLKMHQNPKMRDLNVYFLSGEMGYRLRHLKNQTKLLAKTIILTPLNTISLPTNN